MSTYLELVQELCTECNVGGTAPTSGNFASLTGTPARIKTWVKNADIEIKSKWANWKFLWDSDSVAVVNGTSDYTGPADLGMYDKGTFRLDGNKIQAIEYREFKENYFHADNVPGTPSVVVILPNNQLRVWPEPNTSFSLTFEYYRAPTANVLSAHGDSSEIPSAFHRAIYFTAMMYYANWDAAAELKQQAQEGLYGRTGTGEEGWIKKLEAHQLPRVGYDSIVNDGNYEIQVIAE